jgi:hypothetical protein
MRTRTENNEVRGGGIAESQRKRPLEPPSSATATMAVSLEMNGWSSMKLAANPCARLTRRFRPRSEVERPVPPPIATTRQSASNEASAFTLKRVQTDIAHIFCGFINRQRAVSLAGGGYVIDTERMDTFNKSAPLCDDLDATYQELVCGCRGPWLQQRVLAIQRSGCSLEPLL